MSKRRRAREMAVQMLYQSDLGKTSVNSIFSDFHPAEYLTGTGAKLDAKASGAGTEHSRRGMSEMKGAFDYAKALVSGTLEHLDEIDGLIRQQAEHWLL